jgi:uncharacterized membrane protein
MEALQKMVFLTVILLSIPFLLALYTPETLKTEEKIIIKKPVEEVYNYLKQVKNQSHYSYWASGDINIEKNFFGTDATEGFIMEWKGNSSKIGAGTLELLTLHKNTRLDFKVHLNSPFECIGEAYFTTRPIDSYNTEVVINFNGKVLYPYNMVLWFYDLNRELEKSLNASLTTLKYVLEE